MRKYFGTDGIRRIANTELTPQLVYKVAKAGAYVLSKHIGGEAPTILIGKDTRLSGSLIESAMTAGFLSYGANVISLDIMPTPAIAFLTKKLNATASVVISASHNTYEFNGIKFFSNKGMKISDDIEEEIEDIMDSGKIDELNARCDKIGTSTLGLELEEKYIDFFIENFGKKIKDNLNNDFKVVIDTANGATCKVAEKIFKKLEINFEIIHNSPNGLNINENCGSTHIEDLKKYVIENNMSLGIAYDGDGDRCLAVDDTGNIIDGDKILAIFANYFKEKALLKNDTFVATVMSNIGLTKFAKESNIELIKTKVGDRYVLEEMLKNGFNLGGEQSGHIIMLDYNPTGDGILTSIMLISILLEKKISSSDLAKIVTIYPQVLINAKVKEENKEIFKNDKDVQELIKKVEDELSNSGRVLIRPSGTEPLVRVMIEGENIEYINQKAKEIAKLIEEKSK